MLRTTTSFPRLFIYLTLALMLAGGLAPAQESLASMFIPDEFLPLYHELRGRTQELIPGGRHDLLLNTGVRLETPAQSPWINDQALLVLEQQIRITNIHHSPALNLEVTFSLLPRNLPGYQVVFEERIWPNNHEIIEYPDGSRSGIVRASSLQAGDTLTIIISYNLANTSWEVDRELLVQFADPPRDHWVLSMLHPEPMVESDHPEIVQQAIEIVGDEDNPFRKAALLYSWVNINLEYDEHPAFANLGALAALRNRRGVCTEFASLYVAMLRAVGVPARLVGGFLFTPEHKVNLGALETSQLAHAWAEFYLEGFGWVPAEPTFMLFVNDVREASLNFFAALPQWGHVVSGNSHNRGHVGALFNVTYSGFRDMLWGETVTFIQPGQSLMRDEVKVYLGDYQHRVFFCDQQPILLEGGITMVPMRRIYELLGAEVAWDPEAQRILAANNHSLVELQIGRASIWVNGVVSELIAAPYIDPRTGRTMIPIRAVSEGLGMHVHWDLDARSILLY